MKKNIEDIDRLIPLIQQDPNNLEVRDYFAESIGKLPADQREKKLRMLGNIDYEFFEDDVNVPLEFDITDTRIRVLWNGLPEGISSRIIIGYGTPSIQITRREKNMRRFEVEPTDIVGEMLLHAFFVQPVKSTHKGHYFTENVMAAFLWRVLPTFPTELLNVVFFGRRLTENEMRKILLRLSVPLVANEESQALYFALNSNLGYFLGTFFTNEAKDYPIMLAYGHALQRFAKKGITKSIADEMSIFVDIAEKTPLVEPRHPDLPISEDFFVDEDEDEDEDEDPRF